MRSAAPLTLDVVTGGWLRRRGVRYLLRQRHAAAQRVLAGLLRYPQIGETLAQLDFAACG